MVCALNGAPGASAEGAESAWKQHSAVYTHTSSPLCTSGLSDGIQLQLSQDLDKSGKLLRTRLLVTWIHHHSNNAHTS